MNTTNNASLHERAMQFARNMLKYPDEEQLAVNTISKNVLNGCPWEFVRSTPEFRNLRVLLMPILMLVYRR